MSWLHCMWGVGASLGPYIMGAALEGGHGWNMGYRCIAVLQFALSAVLAASLPLWKKRRASGEKAACLSTEEGRRPLSIGGMSGSQVQKKFWRPFSATALWSRRRDFGLAGYLVLCRGISAEAAAGFVSLFFLGITAGRAISGFLTMKLGDTRMIRLGEAVIFLGILCLFLPFGSRAASAGLILTGLGCAPIYPSIIHSTPEHFGADNPRQSSVCRWLSLCGKPQHAASVRRDCQPCRRGFISRFSDCYPGADGCSA